MAIGGIKPRAISFHDLSLDVARKTQQHLAQQGQQDSAKRAAAKAKLPPPPVPPKPATSAAGIAAAASGPIPATTPTPAPATTAPVPTPATSLTPPPAKFTPAQPRTGRSPSLSLTTSPPPPEQPPVPEAAAAPEPVQEIVSEAELVPVGSAEVTWEFWAECEDELTLPVRPCSRHSFHPIN